MNTTFKEVLCWQPGSMVPEVGRRADILLETNEAPKLANFFGARARGVGETQSEVCAKVWEGEARPGEGWAEEGESCPCGTCNLNSNQKPWNGRCVQTVVESVVKTGRWVFTGSLNKNVPWRV